MKGARLAVPLAIALLLGGALATVWIGQPLLFLLVAAVVVGLLAMPLVARRARAAAPPAPVAVPPEEVELEEGPVTACMRCGSPDVRMARFSEGGIPGGGVGATWICGRCRHRGPALEFDDPTAYRQFVKGLHADREARP